MRIILGFLAVCLLGISATCQEAGNVSYNVPGKVPIIKQPKKMDCWITVATMMLSWRDNKEYSLDEVADKAGDPWKIYYQTNTGLPYQDQDKFIREMGLMGEPPANYLLEAYLEFLKAYGPLWITTGDGFSAHARLLIGIEGSGGYDSTDFVFIDPAKGTIIHQGALKFMKEFEEEARVANRENWKGLRIQIYHFKGHRLK